MATEIGGNRYEIVIGTDVSGAQIGAYIEMSVVEIPRTSPLLIAFRDNATGQVTVSMYREDVAIEVLTYFLAFVEKELSLDNWPLWENTQ